MESYHFSDAVRATVKNYWTNRSALEAKEKALKAQLDGGIIGATYYDQQHRVIADCLQAEAAAADAKLSEIGAAYSAAVDRWATPDGTKMSDPDANLLDGRFPLTLPQFKALAEKHKGDFTFTQALHAYAEKRAASGRENWLPYLSAVTPDAEKRRAAFADVLKVARADLAAPDSGYVVASMEAKTPDTPDAWNRLTAGARATMADLDTIPQG